MLYVIVPPSIIELIAFLGLMPSKIALMVLVDGQ
jgi:hypothetical protein